MKKRFLSVLTTGLFLLCMAGIANAALTTIGTATYGGSDYKLIWDNDNNGKSVVWLDYTNTASDWSPQMNWAAGLDQNLTYNLNPGYSVTWDDTAWRLPDADVSGDIAGYYKTGSEMGHLFYTELGLDGSSGYILPVELNASEFDNLLGYENFYWSATEYPGYSTSALDFRMYNGYQGSHFKASTHSDGCGLAVRSGQVSAVPVPGAIWLLGSGLLGLIGIRRKADI